MVYILSEYVGTTIQTDPRDTIPKLSLKVLYSFGRARSRRSLEAIQRARSETGHAEGGVMARRGFPQRVKRRHIILPLDEDLTRELDRFKTEHHFEYRTEAIRWLIKAALDAKLAPKGE